MNKIFKTHPMLNELNKMAFAWLTSRRCYSNAKESHKKLHEPVMLAEILRYLIDENLNQNDKNIFLDMTFGAGGHSRAILDKCPQSIVYALDRDVYAFKLAQDLAKIYPYEPVISNTTSCLLNPLSTNYYFYDTVRNRLFPMNGKFSDVERLLKEANVAENSIHACLIDCGASSMQFDFAERGFSLSQNGPLDMRMGCNNENITAGDVVNKLDEESLGKILWKYGEERMYKKIAHGIVYFRNAHGPIRTTQQLADIIATTVKQPRSDALSRPTHSATKTFQALRIFVNNELNELHNGISLVHKYLRPAGRMAVISFHSLEDRIVKSHFNDVNVNLDATTTTNEREKKLSYKFRMNKELNNLDVFKSCVKNLWTPLNKKVIMPTQDEIEQNARSRSAKLRIAVKN